MSYAKLLKLSYNCIGVKVQYLLTECSAVEVQQNRKLKCLTCSKLLSEVNKKCLHLKLINQMGAFQSYAPFNTTTSFVCLWCPPDLLISACYDLTVTYESINFGANMYTGKR